MLAIRHVVRVQAPIEIVRTYFTDPKRIVEWWPTRVRSEARVGGAIELEFDNADGRTDRAVGTFTELTTVSSSPGAWMEIRTCRLVQAGSRSTWSLVTSAAVLE